MLISKRNLIASFSTIKKLLKAKIKFRGDEVTESYDKEIPMTDANHTFLEVFSLDSVLKKDENYYLQAFLKECKYIEKKVSKHINDSLNDFSYSDEPDQK